MFRLTRGRPAHHALLVAACALLYLPNLGGPSLWDIDEGNNSACSQGMLESGDYVVPRFNDALRVDKPALLYWLQAAAYTAFGVNEFSARLPSALAALATVLLVYELGRRLFDPATGLLGALVLASAPMFCGAAHFANPDALLCACTALTLLLFWLGFSRGNGLWFVAAGAAAGLGVLAKGPVGVVLPLGVEVLFLLWSRRLGILWDRRVLWAAVACFLVFAPWYGWVAAETKAVFLRDFFLKHNVDRFVNPMEGHAGGLYYYPLVLLAGLAPWSAFLGLAGWFAVGRRVRADVTTPEPSDTMPEAYRFLWCWIAVYFVFFSLAGTKLPNYVLPLYPPAALLVGRFLDRWRRGAVAPSRWWLYAGVACFALVGVAFAVGVVIVGRRGWPGVETWAAVGVLPVAGAVAAVGLVRRGRRGAAVAALGAAAVAFPAILAAWGVAVVDAAKAPRELVGDVFRDQTERDIRVATYRYFQPSLVFYSRRHVWQLASDEEALEQLRYPVALYLVLPDAEWQRLRTRVRTPCRLVGRHRDLYRHCDVVVVTNR